MHIFVALQKLNKGRGLTSLHNQAFVIGQM